MKLILCFAFPLLAIAQTATPLEQGADPGSALFRSNCAFCHGLTAKGGRGPNLVSAPLNHGDSTAAIKSVIHNGVPGTAMPAFADFDDDELAQLAAFLRTLALGTARQGPVPGNPVEGLAAYRRSGCVGCHRVGTEGSVFGPDLTRIGAGRSIEYMRESLINPSADIPDEFHGVTVIQKDGGKVSGIRVNEDTFSVQLRDAAQHFRMFQKNDVRAVTENRESLMPSFASLGEPDLTNLIAYLMSLRGPAIDAGDPKKAQGIK